MPHEIARRVPTPEPATVAKDLTGSWHRTTTTTPTHADTACGHRVECLLFAWPDVPRTEGAQAKRCVACFPPAAARS